MILYRSTSVVHDKREEYENVEEEEEVEKLL
jgi:hypothetical protein